MKITVAGTDCQGRVQELYRRYLALSGHMLGIFLCGFMFFPSSGSQNAFYYLFVLIPMLPVAVVEGIRLARQNWLAAFVFVYLAYMATTSFWSPGFDAWAVLRTYKYGLLIFLYIALVSWLLEHQGKSLRQWLAASPLLFATGALIITFVWLTHPDVPQGRLHGWGAIDYPLSLAALASFAIIVAVSAYQTASRPLQYAYVVAVIILLVFLLLTESLFGVTALAIPLICFAPSLYRRSKLIIPVVALPLAAVTLFYADFFYELVTDPGSWARLDIWQHVWNLSLDSFWFGHGLEAEFNYELIFGEPINQHFLINRVHNVYLACFFYGGIIGLALSVGVTLAALLASFKQATNNREYMAVMLLLLGAGLLAADWSHIIDHPNLLYLLYWLPMVMAIRAVDRGTGRA